MRERKFSLGQPNRDRFLDTDFYRDWLWLVSFAIIFDLDEETFERVVASTEFGWSDRLLDRLTATLRKGFPVGEDLLLPHVVAPLDRAFAVKSPATAEKAVTAYLRTWYTAWRSSAGWGYHERVPKRGYFGYWTFEAVAVVAALDLNDTLLRDNEYYPHGLAADLEE